MVISNDFSLNLIWFCKYLVQETAFRSYSNLIVWFVFDFRLTKKLVRRLTHWLIQFWRRKFWICCNKLWTTISWRKAPTKQPRHWTVAWPNSLSWPLTQNPSKFYCICHCCVKIRMFRMCSYVQSKHLVVHAVFRVQLWPVRLQLTKARNWSRK